MDMIATMTRDSIIANDDVAVEAIETVRGDRKLRPVDNLPPPD
jgi:hypothetical protein